tara:strand:- start:507 stop:836 length:330 start_codon:yes stop_codon:yes gene_type:complete
MTAFDTAWALIKGERPKEKSPPCIFCGNTETEWREDNMMEVRYRLGMSDVPPVFGVWCQNWYADPEKGEDTGCQKFHIPDPWDKMLVMESWRSGVPALSGPSKFEVDNA